VSEFGVRDLELVNDSVSARAKHRCTVTVYHTRVNCDVTRVYCSQRPARYGWPTLRLVSKKR